MLGTTNYCNTQNIKALDLMVSEKEIFLPFPIVSLREIMTPGRGLFRPKEHDWKDLCRVTLLLLHTKYKSSGPHGLREDFLYFPIV